MSSKAERPFGLNSCRDMRDKLEREIERMAQATDRDAMNAAVTAWHLVEWIWDDTQHTPGLRERLAHEAGCAPIRQFGKEDFKAYARECCPDLAYCRIVANNTKHLFSNVYDDDPAFSTTVAPANLKWVNGKDESFTFTNDRGDRFTWTSNAWDIWIVDDNVKKRRAAEVYGQALQWLTNFIYSNKIDEPQADLPPEHQ